MSHQISLEQEIADTLKKVESGEYSSAELKSSLLSVQSHVTGLGGHFSRQLRTNPEFYNERKPEGSTIACRVFDIPELLEMILEHLTIPDLLKFYQCSTSIRDSIESSSKLQSQLSLRPVSSNSYLHLPVRHLTKFVPLDAFDENITGLQTGFFSSEQFPRRRPSRKYEHKNEAQDRTVEIHASFYLLPGQRLPRMGSRVRRMFITQPPLEEMTVALNCCPIYDYGPTGLESPKPERKVSREGGLTVGALYDRAEELLDEHRCCTQAYSGLLDDDGTVKVGVRFVGSMVLQPDDPIYVKHLKSKKKREEEDQIYKKQTAKLEAFCNARRAAQATGDPIPSLEDFVASHGQDADWNSLAHPPHPPLQLTAAASNFFPSQLPSPSQATDLLFPSNDDPFGLLGILPAQAAPDIDPLGGGTSVADVSSTNTTTPETVPLPDVSSADGGISAAGGARSTVDDLTSQPAP